jgi:tripartite-type tricarboxylate transporter receptor subunit TctC
MTDLRPIATVGQLDGIFMLVDAKSPIKTLADFLALAKKEVVAYGSPGVGNGLHLTTEIFAKKAGIKLQHIPYRGASEVMTALLGGSVQMMFVTPPSSIALIKEGRVRPLAFTGTKPFPVTPEVPLMKDLVPGYTSQGSWGMFFAPGKTPDAIIEQLNAEIRKALQLQAVIDVMQRDGYIPDNRDAAAAAAFFRKEVLQAEEAVKAAGIQPN